MNIDLSDVPKWASDIELCNETVIRSMHGGPFAPFGGSFKQFGPSFYKFTCKRCRSVFTEYEVVGDEKCPDCGCRG